MQFWAELRRRNVARVATAYCVVSWLVIQVVSTMVPALRLPDYINTIFAVGLLLGFPVALALAWVFDLTPDGIVRTAGASRTGEDQLRAVRRLDTIVILGLIIIGGLLIWERFTEAPTTQTAPLTGGTIAVLPFDDLSPLGDQRYFADGVSEEILNALATQSTLTVTGRTSSFMFREGGRTLREIGEALGASMLLEGSVRKQGESVRILARLVRSVDGAMLWNETFDGRLDDIFAVQEAVAQQVINTLAVNLGKARTEPAIARPFDAYDRYLRARELVTLRELPAMEEAEQLLYEIIELNPDYAPPRALLSLATRLLAASPGAIGRRPVNESVKTAIEHAESALQLDPDLADGHAIRGLLYLDQKQLLKAEVSLRRALDTNPAHTNARLWLSICLTGKQRYLDAVRELQLLFERDPLFPPAALNLSLIAVGTGQADLVEQVIERLTRAQAPQISVQESMTVLERRRGDIATAIQRLRKLQESYGRIGPIIAPLTQMSLSIGDSASAAQQPVPFAPIRSALSERRFDDAIDMAENLVEASQGFSAFQVEYLTTLAVARRDQELLAYYDDHFTDVDHFGRELFWSFEVQLAPYWTIAYAFHRTGQLEQLQSVIEHWGRAIETSRLNGADNYDLYLNLARWYALQGDQSEVLASLQRAGESTRGLLGSDLAGDYLTELMGTNSQYKALLEKNASRIDEERAVLGLGPFVQASATQGK
ncbi:MAG: hypothetical protein AAF749_10245 [Pseudomonadota bacterium]